MTYDSSTSIRDFFWFPLLVSTSTFLFFNFNLKFSEVRSNSIITVMVMGMPGRASS